MKNEKLPADLQLTHSLSLTLALSHTHSHFPPGASSSLPQNASRCLVPASQVHAPSAARSASVRLGVCRNVRQSISASASAPMPANYAGGLKEWREELVHVWMEWKGDEGMGFAGWICKHGERRYA